MAVANAGKELHHFVSGAQPGLSSDEDDLEDFFGEWDVIESPLNGEEALVSRIVGLSQMYDGKVSVARVVHKREYDDADIFSYAVLVPHGMNQVWEVFPVLSHSKVSMPEATIMPHLSHLKGLDRLDWHETIFESEEDFRLWVKGRHKAFKALDEPPDD